LTASPAAGSANATVALASADSGDVTEMSDSELERLRADNPSGRLLPMLRALARTGPSSIYMNLLGDQRLVMEVEA
jgi:hypothetical protein